MVLYFIHAELRPVKIVVDDNQIITEINYGFLRTFLVGRPINEAELLIKDIICVLDFEANDYVNSLKSLNLFYEHFDKLKDDQPKDMPDKLVPVIRPLIEIAHSDEITLLCILNFKYARIHYYQKCWLVIDLPPGVGKTFAINRVCKMVRACNNDKQRVLITTPTKKTSRLFDYKASTLHANFMIKQASDARFIPSEWSKRIINNNSLFIFDEFSMYGQNVIIDVFFELAHNKKMVVVIGDSCQLPPVMQTRVDWYDETSPSLRLLPFGCYIDDAVDIEIARIDASHYQFRNLIVLLRKCIRKMNKMTKEKDTKNQALGKKTKSKPRCELTVEAIKGWLSYWYLLNVVENLDMTSALAHIARQQNAVLHSIAKLRVAGLFDCEKYTSTFFETFPKEHTQLFESFQPLPIFAVYENVVNNIILDKIDADCKIRESARCQNTLFGVPYKSLDNIDFSTSSASSAAMSLGISVKNLLKIFVV